MAPLKCPGIPQLGIRCNVSLRTRKVCKECEAEWNKVFKAKMICNKCGHTWPLRNQAKNSDYRWCPNCCTKQPVPEDKIIPASDYSAHYVVKIVDIVERFCLKCNKKFKAPRQYRLCVPCRTANATEIPDNRYAIAAGDGRRRRK